ncbi:MAG: family 43 glycosylhydrolase [Microbulbifer sp.]
MSMFRNLSLILALVLPACAAAAESENAGPNPPGQWDAPQAGNPFVPGYWADPTIIVHDDTFYIYVTTDGPGWGANELTVWHSKDFKNWTNTVLNWPGRDDGFTNVWAPDVIEGTDGRFYMYISINHEIWAGVADHPLGPWRNALDEDKPFIALDFDPEVHHIDANAFIDDDGQPYLYWGSGWEWERGPGYVGLLADDMVSFTKPPRRTHPPHFFEGPYMLKRDGRYFLMYSDGKVSEPSYKIRYSYSKSPTGPWTEPEQSPILVTSADRTVFGPGHHSVLQWKGDYYLVYHRDANPFMGMAHRQLCIDRLVFNKDNLIERVVPTHRGAFPQVTDDQQPANLAFGAKVTASSAAENYEAERLVDDNYGTRWSAAESDESPSLTIDLGEVKTTRRIEIFPEYATKYYKYKVETSSDGERWKGYSDSSTAASRGMPWVHEKDTDARYVRVSLFPGEDVDAPRQSLWEVKVY